MGLSPDEEQAVFRALENDKFEWRTVKGIAKESKVPEPLVRAVIESAGDRIVRASALSKDGQELFASAARFQKRSNVTDRLRGAFSNRRA